MKTILVVFSCLAFFAVSFGQDKPPIFEAKKYAMIAQTPDCESLNDYLSNCLRYPEECLKSKDEGTEVVKFEITPEGELKNFEVINSVSPEIDEHLIEMLKKTSGMWSPGMKNGVPVSTEKEISVAFQYGELGKIGNCRKFKNKAKACLNKGTKLLLVKNKPEKALRIFDRGILYCPYEDCLRLARGLCRYELGDVSGARNDWERMTIAGIAPETKDLVEKAADLKGYNELAHFMND